MMMAQIPPMTPRMPTPQMPTLPASVVKFIISFLPPCTPPEILLNIFKAFIYYEADANAEVAYYKNIQQYITDLAYPKLKSPYFILPPIELPLTDREIMYMVDIQLTHTWMNPFHDDYLPETIQEFCECNHLMKSQPEFDWTNLSIYNIKYIYALEEALLTRSKGMLYWLEKNFCTFVAMSAIYIYFKHGLKGSALSNPTASGIARDELGEYGFERAEPFSSLFDDDFFLDFLVRVNTKGHSGRKPEVLLRLAAKGAALSNPKGSALSNPKGAALSNPMSVGGETPGASLSIPYSPSSSCGGETPLIKPNLKLYNKLLDAIKLNKK